METIFQKRESDFMQKTSDLKQWKMDSEIGPLYLVASEKGLRGVYLQKANIPLLKILDKKSKSSEILFQTVSELKEYFNGKRNKFSVPLDLVGTSFQRQVWKELARIPYGKTCSYRDIATRIQNQKAVRAVGGANGKNPVCIIVPCHRVIAADGTLGGYSGGLHIKKKLLKIEGVL